MVIEETVVVPADHPALAGHFPGDPIVPGAVLLDRALEIAERDGGRRISRITRAKFTSPLRGGAPCLMRLESERDGMLRLTCTAKGEVILTAALQSHKAPASP